MIFKTYIKIYDKSKRNLHPNNLNLKKMMELKIQSNQNSNREITKLLIQLIDEQINELKIERWAAWEKNHLMDSSSYDQEIEKLTSKKKELLGFFQKAQPVKDLTAHINLTLN